MIATSAELALLGLTEDDFAHLATLASAEGPQQLDQLKCRAKQAFRKRALVLHPDQTGNDPAKTAQFKSLVSLMQAIDALTFDDFDSAPQVFDVPEWAFYDEDEQPPIRRRSSSPTVIVVVEISEEVFASMLRNYPF
jgi:hypothetical protein